MEKQNEQQNKGMAITFGDIPKIPTQDAIDGIKFDFNVGLRVWIPKGAKSYHIRFVDLGTKSCVYDAITPEGGALPLQERINLLKDADFYIGLSSGLSWLAWGCQIPVIMISGFTNPLNEYKTPYRVINYNACNSCWNDMRLDFDHFDFLWCPRHKGTDRHFECTKLISAEQVITTIKKIPTFKGNEEK